MKTCMWCAFWCGQIGHVEDYCNKANNHPSDGRSHSYPENVVETQPSPMHVGTKKMVDLGGVEEREVMARPWLGPWVVTTKIRPPRAAPASARVKKSAGVQAEAGVVAPERVDLAGKQASPPSSPPTLRGGKSQRRWLVDAHWRCAGKAGVS